MEKFKLLILGYIRPRQLNHYNYLDVSNIILSYYYGNDKYEHNIRDYMSECTNKFLPILRLKPNKSELYKLNYNIFYEISRKYPNLILYTITTKEIQNFILPRLHNFEFVLLTIKKNDRILDNILLLILMRNRIKILNTFLN